MADKKRSAQDNITGRDDRSVGTGGGKGAPSIIEVDMVGNARLRHEDPSPDNRPRGDRSPAART